MYTTIVVEVGAVALPGSEVAYRKLLGLWDPCQLSSIV